MGIRSRLKGIVKRAVGMESPSAGPSAPSSTPSAPSASGEKSSNAVHAGNLSDGEDTPWYLKYDDVEGWDNTDATDDLDSE